MKFFFWKPLLKNITPSPLNRAQQTGTPLGWVSAKGWSREASMTGLQRENVNGSAGGTRVGVGGVSRIDVGVGGHGLSSGVRS